VNPLTKLAEAQARFDDAQRGRRRAGDQYVQGAIGSDAVDEADGKLAEAIGNLSRAEEAARIHLAARAA